MVSNKGGADAFLMERLEAERRIAVEDSSRNEKAAFWFLVIGLLVSEGVTRLSLPEVLDFSRAAFLFCAWFTFRWHRATTMSESLDTKLWVLRRLEESKNVRNV